MDNLSLFQKISPKKCIKQIYFAAVSNTNVPLLSVVVRHHILEESQLVGQSVSESFSGFEKYYCTSLIGTH